MKIYVRVKDKSIYNKVEEFGNNRYMVYTGYSLEDADLNQTIIGVMSKHLSAPSGRFVLISGQHDKDKVFDLN